MKEGILPLKSSSVCSLIAALVETERRPRKNREAQIDGGGVESVNGVFQLDSKRFVDVEPSCHSDQTLSEVAVDAPIPSRVGVGQGIARYSRAKTQVVELGRLSAKTSFDIAQALAIRQLRKRHREILIQATETLDLVVSAVAGHTTTEGC
jgi:hypothetical protein